MLENRKTSYNLNSNVYLVEIVPAMRETNSIIIIES